MSLDHSNPGFSGEPVGGFILERETPALSLPAAFAAIMVLFFTWGFLTSLNDVLVAALRAIFDLPYRGATLVELTFFSTCFVTSFPASSLVVRVGYKATMTLGLLVLSAGALCFAGACSTHHFPVFLFALAVLACGSATLQTAAGPYVSLLGAAETAASRFSLALAVNSFGAMLAPAFGAVFLLRDVALTSAGQAGSLRKPYLGIAAGLVVLGLLVSRLRLPRVALPPHAGGAPEMAGTYRMLLAQPRLMYGVATMLLYVGAEIAIGSLLINFLGQQDTSALTPRGAAWLASLYGAGAMTGRFLAPLVLKRFQPHHVLSLAASCAVTLVMISVVSTGRVASFSLLAVGLCNSVMVPILFTSAISGLGPNTARGAGLLVAALIGGAIIPVAQGALADRIGLHHSFVLPALCYAAVFCYGRFLAASASLFSKR